MLLNSLRRLRDVIAPPGPLYEDAHYLVAHVPLDPNRASAWVPWPLSLERDAPALVFTAWFPHASFGSVYREAGIFFRVKHLGRSAIFCPWMLVDDDAALVLGREVLGYPKKLGAITWAQQGDSIESVATRRGAELVRMTGTLGDALATPTVILGQPHRNVRGGPLGIPQIIAFTPRERPREVRQANLTVSIGTSERDPLAELGLGQVERAYLHRVDLLLSAPPVPVGVASLSWALRNLLFRVR